MFRPEVTAREPDMGSPAGGETRAMRARDAFLRELDEAKLAARRAAAAREDAPTPLHAEAEHLCDVHEAAGYLKISEGKVRERFVAEDIAGAFRPLGEWRVPWRTARAEIERRRGSAIARRLDRRKDGRPRDPDGPVPLPRLARWLRESPLRLRARCEAGELEGARRPEGNWRIRLEDLRAYVADQLRTRADLKVSDFIPEEVPR